VRDRDVASLVGEIEQRLNAELDLPPGYSITYGGQFENLQHATARLMIAVPVALLLILFLLYLAFDSMREALVIFAAVPLAAVGGILALELRGLPFSISAGIGFIALFGVAVLNGLVLVNEFIRLRGRDGLDLKGLIEEGARARLRPVLTTALVASLGFLPMAISTTNGAEVQRPLATVVIGGLVTSTLLTLVVLPAIYFLVEKRRFIRLKGGALVALLLFFGSVMPTQAQEALGLNELVQSAHTNRVEVISAGLQQQHWQQERKMSYTLPNLSLSVQYGQINYEKNDYNANVHQDLGKPWTAGTHKRWADAGAAQAAKQAELAAVIEMARRALAQQLSAAPVFDSPLAVKDYLQLHLGNLPHEVFAVLFLDAQHRLIKLDQMFTGTLGQTSVYPREVVKLALMRNAGAVILAHNHPSGVAEPSRADEFLTQSLKNALALVDVRVLDHLVIGQGQVVSFAERGLL
jgi:cobalt-zinc-cadmium resistance protein CzcA